MTNIQVRRIRDAAEESDGARILVNRLWPRGISKERAALTKWLKNITPSNELRKAYHGGELDADAFAAAYRGELEADDEARAEARAELRRLLAEHETVTLLFDAANTEFNHATVLHDWILEGGLDATR